MASGDRKTSGEPGPQATSIVGQGSGRSGGPVQGREAVGTSRDRVHPGSNTPDGVKYIVAKRVARVLGRYAPLPPWVGHLTHQPALSQRYALGDEFQTIAEQEGPNPPA